MTVMEDAGGGGRWLWLRFASILLLRPLLAVSFVLSLILLSWWVAWKTVLSHVPVVQEICGLRKKPAKPKPQSRHRLSRFYNSSTSATKLAVALWAACVLMSH